MVGLVVFGIGRNTLVHRQNGIPHVCVCCVYCVCVLHYTRNDGNSRRRGVVQRNARSCSNYEGGFNWHGIELDGLNVLPCLCHFIYY